MDTAGSSSATFGGEGQASTSTVVDITSNPGDGSNSNSDGNGNPDDQNVIPDGSSELHIQVRNNNPDSVKILLQNNGQVNARDANDNPPLLYAGTRLTADDKNGIRKYEEVVAALVDSGADVNLHGEVHVSCRRCDHDRSRTPPEQNRRTTALFTAVTLCSISAVQKLMREGADPMWKTASGITPTHQAASSGSEALLQAVLHEDRELLLHQINDRDAEGCTPTHYAAESGSHECVERLIKLGANLSIKDNSGISVIEAILALIPRPKSFLMSLLDSCISGSQKEQPGKRGYKVELDFSILCPDGCKTQSDVLGAIFTSRHLPTERCRSIFKHPLVEAFIYYKWHSLRYYFLGILVANILFVVTLTTFVSMLFYYRVGENVMVIGLVRYGHLILSLFFVSINIGQYRLRFCYYIGRYETWTHFLSALMSTIWATASIFQYQGIYCGVEAPSWMRNLLAVQLPFAWAGLMLLLGRLHVVGAKAMMFGSVLKNALLTFTVLGFIVIGFSLSFFIQFHDTSSEAFGNPWLSFANTLVMMTGEYGYMDIFGTEEKIENLPIVSRIIFLSFVLVATIVLMNLIIGLAVSDIQSLSDEGKWRCMKKRAESVDLLENLFPTLIHFKNLSQNVTVPVYGKPKDEGYEKTMILPKKTVQSLVNVAVRERARELARRSRAAEEISITFPYAPEGTLQHRVYNTIEVFIQEITHLLSSHASEGGEDNEAPGIIRPKKDHLKQFVKKGTKSK